MEKKKVKLMCMGERMAIIEEYDDGGYDILYSYWIHSGFRKKILEKVEEKNFEITNRECFTWL